MWKEEWNGVITSKMPITIFAVLIPSFYVVFWCYGEGQRFRSRRKTTVTYIYDFKCAFLYSVSTMNGSNADVQTTVLNTSVMIVSD